MKQQPLKILLGGVPFGRNNVGDEAILECVVKIVRQVCPEAQITVSTDDGPATAAKLNVRTVELFGFEPPFSRQRMKEELESANVFIWSGATGLSDYPEIPLSMLQTAQAAGCKTVLWGVGMNDRLNPIFYTLLPGRRRSALELATRCLFGTVDFVRMAEHRKEHRTRRKIADTLNRADLVALRDPESQDEILKCGPVQNSMVGADSALLLEPAELNHVSLPDSVRELLSSDHNKIGICISAQRQIRDSANLITCLDELVEDNVNRILFVPMNPVTDAALMEDLRQQMKHPERAAVVKGRYEPAEILAVASRLDVIASSRLHLLILASIVHVPIIGISRGSKVDNFLQPFGLTSVGDVDSCDFAALKNEVLRLLRSRTEFEEKSRDVRSRLLHRLNA
ncbi:MAG: polysaccharide pyruvyl transferase family protein, partial [Kiritimatiellales bacterium]